MQTYNGSMHLLFSLRRQKRKINGEINAAQTAHTQQSDCAHTSPFSARHPPTHSHSAIMHPGGGRPTTPADIARTQQASQLL